MPLNKSHLHFFMSAALALTAALGFWHLACPAGAGGPQKLNPVFEKDILPILQAKCLNCHGDQKRKADLDMRSKAAMLQGGESGPSFKPGTIQDSPLWDKIATDKMPPGKDKLSAGEKEIIKRWIETGAHALNKSPLPDLAEASEVTDADRDFWSFRKPVRPAIPKIPVRHPVDAFILAELKNKGLTMSPEIDRGTLLRRVTFDLLGLPPTAKEIEAFLADKSADAYEKVVDRLLTSSHYGERWGRHWLDLAGYADSEGILDADYVRSAAWRYRDYVIRAFNSDKPYDLFLQEQLAGDELVNYWTVKEKQKGLPPHVIEALTATGYLRNACDTSRPDFVKIKDAPGYYFQTLDDTVKIVASSTMGLTVHCAKCHSHKYDPIPQTDYYRLQAIFMSGYRPSQWVPQVERKIMATPAQEGDALEKIEAAIDALRKEQAELQQTFAEKLFKARLAKLPDDVRKEVRISLELAPDKRSQEQTVLAKKYQAELKPTGVALNKALLDIFADYKKEAGALSQKIQAQEKQRPAAVEIRAFYDLPGEAKTFLLRRGEYRNPGREVKPGTLSVLATSQPFQWSPRTEEQAKTVKTSGRRLAFARWLTQPDHPLTARVLVNRLWLHHFGQGIVSTPENFGRTGSPPSHPELLDWLACEFTNPTAITSNPSPSGRAEGVRSASATKPTPWSIKHIHRLILTSAAYRQASKLDPVEHARAKAVDPNNRLLWRQRMRRLEAEGLRDAILSVSGNLNPQMFGPPVSMQRQGDGQVVVSADAKGSRRSVYLQVRRSQPLTFLQLFDQPVIETNCTRRDTSTVATQALTLLNSDFMIKQAETFADRILAETKDNPATVASHAIVLAFGRAATESEVNRLNAFLDEQTKRYAAAPPTGKADTPPQPAEARRRALADLCQMLLSSNEFAYVD